MLPLSHLFDVHGLPSYDKQLSLASVVEGRRYSVSYARGVLSFGSDLSFAIETLGSQSDYDNTWLWAWANHDIAEWPIEASRRVQAYGLTHGVAEFVDEQFTLEAIDGHYLTMIATGLLGADAYYRCPYDEGAAFVVIQAAPEVRALSDLSAHSIAKRVIDFICRYECRHQTAVENYLRYKGFTWSYAGRELTGSGAGGQSLKARFTSEGHLEQIEAVVTEPVYPPRA